MRIVAAFILPILLGAAGARQGSGQVSAAADVLTLDQAVALALQYNRIIRGSELEVRRFDERLAAARTLRLPSFSLYTLGSQRLTALDFRFPRGAFGIFPGIGPIPAADTSIHSSVRAAALVIGRIDQPLSQQYRIGLGMRSLDLGRQMAAQQERIQKQTVVDQVKRAYYSILQLQSSLESVEESIRLYKELDRVTEEYVRQQTALRAQSLEVKTRLARAEYDALALRNPLQTQKEQLNSLLGRSLQTEFQVSPVPEPSGVEADLDAARKLALEQRPEVRQARLRVQQAENERRVKKAEYIPDVSLNFSYVSPINYGSLIPSQIAGIGLLVDWTPFDWGKKKRELAERSLAVEQAQLALRETEDQVALDVGSRFRKLLETRQLITVSRLAQETARENLRVVKNRYGQESSLLKDVLQAQAALAEADSQSQQALLNYWSARADFEKALGMGP